MCTCKMNIFAQPLELELIAYLSQRDLLCVALVSKEGLYLRNKSPVVRLVTKASYGLLRVVEPYCKWFVRLSATVEGFALALVSGEALSFDTWSRLVYLRIPWWRHEKTCTIAIRSSESSCSAERIS